MRSFLSERILALFPIVPPDISVGSVALKDQLLSRAYASTFVSQILSETFDSLPITNLHIESFIAFFFIWTYLSLETKKTETTMYRLDDFIEYTSIRKNTSRFLFIIYIIFCKNMDNVM